jgi:hypothetical protein
LKSLKIAKEIFGNPWRLSRISLEKAWQKAWIPRARTHDETLLRIEAEGTAAMKFREGIHAG